MNRISRNVFLVLFFLTGFGMLFANHSTPLADPRESVYVEIAREMLQCQDYLTPRLSDTPLPGMPPLYYWFTAGIFQLFGVGEFTARFPSAVMAVLTVMASYYSATRLWNERVGFWTGMILGSSLLFYFTGKASGTETTCLFFCTAALFCFLLEEYWLFYAFCGLAVLAQGFMGIIFPFSVILFYLVLTGKPAKLLEMHVLPGILLSCVFFAPWYFLQYEAHGMEVLQSALRLDPVAGTGLWEGVAGRDWKFCLFLILAGLFPWTGLLLKSVKDGICESKTGDLRKNIFLLFWCVAPLLFCGLGAIGMTGGVLLAFPAMAVLSSWNMERMLREDKANFKSWAFVSLITFLAASACWVFAGRELPGLAFGGIVLGIMTLVMGIGITVSLLIYKDGMLAAWLHAGTGMLAMIIIYVFLLPVAPAYCSVKDIAAESVSGAEGNHPTVYVEKVLRPGFMFYTQESVAELDIGNPEGPRIIEEKEN